MELDQLISSVSNRLLARRMPARPSGKSVRHFARSISIGSRERASFIPESLAPKNSFPPRDQPDALIQPADGKNFAFVFPESVFLSPRPVSLARAFRDRHEA
ncbi:hypothetical protein ACQR0Y_03060 [Bradyrhizobium oligotrophicum]|uniref:hypothetical protein n=1 Tax=Bradyrhizobium oligotrophicum TaxID=44255 RepID=UPI003EB6FFD9